MSTRRISVVIAAFSSICLVLLATQTPLAQQATAQNAAGYRVYCTPAIEMTRRLSIRGDQPIVSLVGVVRTLVLCRAIAHIIIRVAFVCLIRMSCCRQPITRVVRVVG